MALGGSRQRALLAVLLLHANESLSTDALLDDLWSQRPPATAAVISTFEVELPGALEVYCTGGRIMIEESFIRPERMTVHRTDSEPEELVAQWPGGGYTFEAQEVMRCLRAGEQQSPLVPWRDTLAVARVLDRWRAAIGGSEEVQP